MEVFLESIVLYFGQNKYTNIKASFHHADFSTSVQISAFKHAHSQLNCQKKSAHAEKIVRKKVELQSTFFVCLVRSVINLSFSTHQIEELINKPN